MEVDLQNLFGLHVTWCAQLYSLAETPQPPPRIWTCFTRALLVSINRRHLSVTLWVILLILHQHSQVIQHTLRSPWGSTVRRSFSTLTPSFVHVISGGGLPLARQGKVIPLLNIGSATACASSAGASQLGATGGFCSAVSRLSPALAASRWDSSPLCRRRCLLASSALNCASADGIRRSRAMLTASRK